MISLTTHTIGMIPQQICILDSNKIKSTCFQPDCTSSLHKCVLLCVFPRKKKKKNLSWCAKVATESAVQRTQLPSKICACYSESYRACWNDLFLASRMVRLVPSSKQCKIPFRSMHGGCFKIQRCRLFSSPEWWAVGDVWGLCQINI